MLFLSCCCPCSNVFCLAIVPAVKHMHVTAEHRQDKNSVIGSGVAAVAKDWGIILRIKKRFDDNSEIYNS